VVTGFVISLVLMIIGAFFLSERLSLINLIGVVLCIIGVAMIGYSDDSERKIYEGHSTAGDNGYQSDVERVK
jgi:drug/metabolite transporter (DMT)-like permease